MTRILLKSSSEKAHCPISSTQLRDSRVNKDCLDEMVCHVREGGAEVT
jgi:hypothetical protein